MKIRLFKPPVHPRHSERSEATQKYGQGHAKRASLDCFASPAMTQSVHALTAHCNDAQTTLNKISSSVMIVFCVGLPENMRAGMRQPYEFYDHVKHTSALTCRFYMVSRIRSLQNTLSINSLSLFVC
jgi:hypothetical protein